MSGGRVRGTGGYRARMTTTPQEPLPEPEVVPSGDPVPTEPEPTPPGEPDAPEVTPL